MHLQCQSVKFFAKLTFFQLNNEPVFFIVFIVFFKQCFLLRRQRVDIIVTNSLSMFIWKRISFEEYNFLEKKMDVVTTTYLEALIGK